MEWVSILIKWVSPWISVGGLVFSIVAWRTANQAKKDAKSAVDGTIKKVNNQRDILEIQNIISKLETARSAANKWTTDADKKLQTGHDYSEALKSVRDAQDLLECWVPADMDKTFKDQLERKKKDLGDYCDKISAPENNENHWKGVVTSTQSLRRLLRPHLRKLENDIVRQT